MSYEIEAKFKITDEQIGEIIKIIEDLGGKFQYDLNQKDTYFKHTIHPDIKTDCPTYLRVRTSNDKSYIAMHYKVNDYKWEEIETLIEDGEKMRQIYKNLNFEIDVEVCKKRKVFMIENTEIVIDDVKNCGLFIEIETTDIDTLYKYCDIFKFEYGNKDEYKDLSYADLVRKSLNNKIL